MKLHLLHCLLAGISSLALGTDAFSQSPVKGTNNFLVETLPGIPSEIDYNSRDGRTAPPSTLQSFGVQTTATVPDELQQIIALCDADPLALFNFVSNHIRFTPHRGFRKGPLLTLLTREGNDSDRAELLVNLLRAAGQAAAYDVVFVRIPFEDAFAFFGVDNLAALGLVAGSAGYLADIDNLAEELLIELQCATINVEGTQYRLFPAVGEFESVSGIDLSLAMQHSTPDLVAAAGGTTTAHYAQGISATSVQSYLDARTQNLLDHVATENPNAALDEILGARNRLPSSAASLEECFPSYFDVFNNFPSQEPFLSLNQYVDIWLGSLDGSGNFNSFLYPELKRREIGAQKLHIAFGENDQAQIFLDDTLIAEESLPLVEGPLRAEIRVDHPYPDAVYDELHRFVIDRGGVYTFIIGTGGYDAKALEDRNARRI